MQNENGNSMHKEIQLKKSELILKEEKEELLKENTILKNELEEVKTNLEEKNKLVESLQQKRETALTEIQRLSLSKDKLSQQIFDLTKKKFFPSNNKSIKSIESDDALDNAFIEESSKSKQEPDSNISNFHLNISNSKSRIPKNQSMGNIPKESNLRLATEVENSDNDFGEGMYLQTMPSKPIKSSLFHKMAIPLINSQIIETSTCKSCIEKNEKAKIAFKYLKNLLENSYKEYVDILSSADKTTQQKRYISFERKLNDSIRRTQEIIEKIEEKK